MNSRAAVSSSVAPAANLSPQSLLADIIPEVKREATAAPEPLPTSGSTKLSALIVEAVPDRKASMSSAKVVPSSRAAISTPPQPSFWKDDETAHAVKSLPVLPVVAEKSAAELVASLASCSGMASSGCELQQKLGANISMMRRKVIPSQSFRRSVSFKC